jgi:hypothetical protein
MNEYEKSNVDYRKRCKALVKKINNSTHNHHNSNTSKEIPDQVLLVLLIGHNEMKHYRQESRTPSTQ